MTQTRKAQIPKAELLGALSGLHTLLRDLVSGLPAAAANRCLDPRLGSPGWQLARAVYRETYWLREVVAGDSDLTDRVRHLFPADSGARDEGDLVAICARLPPPDHLVNWAAEIQEEHLRRLATPGALPPHPLLADDRLSWFLLQEAALAYERILALKRLDAIHRDFSDYRVTRPLVARGPDLDLASVTQGHYRIGSRGDPFAYDNELPPQAVELASFRIARRPVSNAEMLAFVEAGGYAHWALWDEPGRQWLDRVEPRPKAPLGWRRDQAGQWYEIHLNGPSDLPPDQPAGGLNRHEARAFAAWVAGLGGDHAGAVIQHEYQWELAARSGLLEGTGRVWEWSANPFHPYPDFTPFPDGETSQAAFEHGEGVLRGACLHTQRCLRRASFRLHRHPEDRTGFSGVRLVYPPAKT